MATITLRLSAKTDKATSQHEILIRFRHGKIDQYGATNVFVQPEYWSDEEQGKIVIPNWRTLTDERKKTQKDLEGKNERLTKIKSFVQSSFQELDKQAVEKGWLKKLINGFNFPTTADTTEAQEEQKQKSFFDWFELFLATKNYPHGSTKSFRVLEGKLGRYQGYKQ